MIYLVGIDIGGAFTGAVLLDDQADGPLLKTPTAPNACGGGI
jgi:N-methylhydantoinase A/oxoprolinase/acetone carboxylase beta subunit